MSTGFKDPEEQYPSQPYQDNQTTNKAAREEWEPYAKLAADAPPGVDLGIRNDWQPKYPYNKVEETSSGHRIEVDDTSGGERLSYVHKDGSALEMYPDGENATTVLLNSVGKMVKLVGDDFTMIVNGNGDIHYNGNLNLNVSGDFNISCNNFTVTTQGKQVEEIKQEKIENFVGDRVVTTQGNKSEVVLGAYTVESMSGDTHIVSKGGVKISAEEDVEILAGTEVRVSAEERITTSAPENFMVGKCVTVAGANGTIGGENMQMYTKNLRANGSVYADETVKTKQVNFERADGDVVHAHLVGDVTGKADEANQADFATTAGQAPTGTAGVPGTNDAAPSNTQEEDNTAETKEPTSAIMTEALNKTKTLGVRKVTVDDGKISNSVKGSDGSSGEATTDNTANRPDTFGDGEPTAGTGSITDEQRAALQQAEAEGLLNGSTAAEVEAAINDVANEIGADPAAVAAVIQVESKFSHPYSATNPFGYRGAFQMGEATWGHTADGSGTLGGLTWGQFQNASYADQIRAYPDWARAQGIDGVWKGNLNKYSPATQAALIQGAQFNPAAVSGRGSGTWWTQFSGGNPNIATTKTHQSEDLRYKGSIPYPTVQSMTDYYEGKI